MHARLRRLSLTVASGLALSALSAAASEDLVLGIGN